MKTIAYQIKIEDIPSPPSVAVKLLELFGCPDVSISDIANVIQIDPALTAKIIAYCNSPLIASSRTVETVDRAVVILGANAVRMLSLSFSLVEIKASQADFDFSLFWKRSLALAVSMQSLARFSDRDASESFLVGLMINFGEIALYQHDADSHAAANESGDSIESIMQFEQERFGTNRFEVGAQILTEWEFPKSIIDCVRQVAEHDDAFRKSVDIAWQLACIFTTAIPDAEQVERCRTYLHQLLQFNELQQEELFAGALDRWNEYSQLLNFGNEMSATSLREIELAAKMKMTEISMSQFHMQQKIEQENAQLRSTIGRDTLTGLYNRRAYDEQTPQTLSRCRRMQKPFTLLVIDIDHFKHCNDQYGHQIGDEALKHVGNMLGSTLRDYDNLYRYGGEEFVLTLPECEGVHALIVAERLRKIVEDTPLVAQDQTIPLTVSVGIVSTECTNAFSLPDLFAIADQCLYKAKKSGRNRCALAEPADSP